MRWACWLGVVILLVSRITKCQHYVVIFVDGVPMWAKQMRVHKEQHLTQIQELDFQAHTSGLDDNIWL
jgi:predicted nucleic acid-binding Zn ribbon protein